MKKSVLMSSILSLGAIVLVPVVAFAQAFNPRYINGVVDNGRGWLGTAITVIMALMVLWFLIGVFRYIAEKDPGKLAEKRKVMLNGLIGLFVAVSVWGIIRIAGNVLDTTNNNSSAQLVCPPGMNPDIFNRNCV